VNRRHLLRDLLITAGVSLSPELVRRLDAQQVSPTELDEIFRSLARAAPLPGEARIVFQALDRMRTTVDSDPRIQPALEFDPEVDV